MNAIILVLHYNNDEKHFIQFNCELKVGASLRRSLAFYLVINYFSRRNHLSFPLLNTQQYGITKNISLLNHIKYNDHESLIKTFPEIQRDYCF